MGVMALLESAAQVGFLVVTASIFMHVSARFWLDDAEFRRAVAVVVVLVVIGLGLAAVQPPLVLSIVFLAAAALIVIQVAYDIEMKESVLIALVYLVLTAIVGGVTNALLRILG